MGPWNYEISEMSVQRDLELHSHKKLNSRGETDDGIVIVKMNLLLFLYCIWYVMAFTQTSVYCLIVVIIIIVKCLFVLALVFLNFVFFLKASG